MNFNPRANLSGELTLEQLQSRVFVGWTGELYSEEFKGRACLYKDFDHALKHVLKAAVKLQNVAEEADHADSPLGTAFPNYQIGVYLADIVISAARLANVTPSGMIDLRVAIEERLKAKIDPKEKKA